MSAVVWIATLFLTLHATHSYILLTANLDDVQAIVKQLADSPVADQIKKIWRRASSQANQFVERSNAITRAHEDDSSNSVEESNARESNGPSYLEENQRRSQPANDEQANMNASVYASSVKETEPSTA